ncbi:MAG TPA: thioredoxin family protein, partial [Oceanipulchritudo sp.]|nr:thioredoxin family protein [Oceanipulchritudo sp.]
LIALGLSTPYLLLSAFPGTLRWLPKPGAWMEAFKQMMAFLLYASVAYLVWVLAGQLTDTGGYSTFSLLKVLMGLVLLALSLWIYGRWAAYYRPVKTRLAGVLASALILVAALGIGFSGTRAMLPGGQSISWEHWEPGKADALAREGRIVYVDFTARWCVTCQTNKAAVFSSARVLEKLAELDVVLLKADWTNRDPEISQALAAFNRSAVPFNLIYAPQQDAPILLPEILTPGIVIDALEELGQQ